MHDIHTLTINLRVGGRIASELTRIANSEQNSLSAVARRLIATALGESGPNRYDLDRVEQRSGQ